ncbi:MAG: chemotaxis protein CheW [Deltaproteobacteria bacterium]|nr:chemotaxis protein CheW [Deltaproteobacteria bacterium]
MGVDGAAMVVFELAGERYGVPAAAVEEVLRAVAPVEAAEALPGGNRVIDLRGERVPLVALAGPREGESAELCPEEHLLVVRRGTRRLAVRVDRVLALERVDPVALAPATELEGASGLPVGLVRLVGSRAPEGRRAALEGEPVVPDAPSPEESAAILRERARRLAARPTGESGPRRRREVVSFTSGGGRYALELAEVREVRRAEALTSVAGAPPGLAGVMPLRDALLPVFELGVVLGGPPRPPTDASRVLLLGERGAEVGVLVEAVLSAAFVAAEELRPLTGGEPSPPRELVKGVTPEGLALLDGAALREGPWLRIERGDGGR